MAIVEPSLCLLSSNGSPCSIVAGKLAGVGGAILYSASALAAAGLFSATCSSNKYRLNATPSFADSFEALGFCCQYRNQSHVCSCTGHDKILTNFRYGKANKENTRKPFKMFNPRIQEEDDGLYGLDADFIVDDGNFQDASILKAVVKVYCISAQPNYSLPWQLQRQQASTGSGFIISDRRLLTNAHCVEHHTQVTVKKTGDDTKYIATVLTIGEECDLALLTVEEDEFWEDVEPLQFGGLPHLQDTVTVVGYPIGGDTISVSKGVVSRIEVSSYAHGDSELLALQIDAAINPGNSGGPALNENGDCVGIAFQSYQSADNIGYVIPTPIIIHFLKDYSLNGKYTGFPCLGVSLQKIENPDLRALLKMKPKQKGVLIQKVEPTSPSKNILKAGDVILSFDGIPISNEATIPLRPREQIAFSFLVSQKFTGDEAVLRVLRDGTELELATTLKPRVQLVPTHIKRRHPSYFIVAGLVFTPVSEPLLQEDYWGDKDLIGMKIRVKASYTAAEFEGQEIVLLSEVLAHAVNIGYEDLNFVQVLKFNGYKIRNTRHLAQLVDACDSEYMQFELDENIVIVLDAHSAHASTREILKDYCIPQDRSQDLQASWDEESLNGAFCSST